jgi:peptide/nickel transport system permease protein
MNIKDLRLRAARDRLFIVGAVLVSVLVFAGVFADFVAPFDPLQQHLGETLRAPGGRYWLGTDWAGRDLLSRLIAGSRITLSIAAGVIALAGSIGLLLGLLAGYAGGVVDNIIVAITDLIFAFPSLILALSIAVLLGVSTKNLVLALAILYTPTIARVTRGAVLTIKARPYVEAARAVGCSAPRVLFIHILPNVTAPVIVQLTIGFSWCILTEAGLTYLGFGAQPPDASWGMVLNEGRNTFLVSPWPSLFAGIIIGIAVLGFNLLGDGLRDVLDPTLRRL